MKPQIQLLGFVQSRAFRCLWMLEELGLPYQFIYAKPQSARVVQYNPLGKVPVLVIKQPHQQQNTQDIDDTDDHNNDKIKNEDDFVLYESGAIVTYLGDKYRHHTPPLQNKNGNSINKININSHNSNNITLVPVAGTKERGLYDQTLSVLQTELDAQGLWIHRKHEAMGEYFTYIPAAVTHARKYFHKTNRMLGQQLQKSAGPYLLGTQFTAVDIVYIQCLQWSTSIGWDDQWKDEPRMQHYVHLCQSRPAYQHVAAMQDVDYDVNDDDDAVSTTIPTTTVSDTAIKNSKSKL